MISISAVARIGETREELVARYGTNYTITTTNSLRFTTAAHIVVVELLDGRSALEFVECRYYATRNTLHTIRDRIAATKNWDPISTRSFIARETGAVATIGTNTVLVISDRYFRHMDDIKTRQF